MDRILFGITVGLCAISIGQFVLTVYQMGFQKKDK